MTIRAKRHRVYVMFWPWDWEPFVCEADIAQVGVSKSVAQGQTMNITLYPRTIRAHQRIHTGTTIRGEMRTQSYIDVLKPNDWIFIFVDPQDGNDPDPLALGFIDSVFANMSVDQQGMIRRSVNAVCTGWEKAIRNASAITSPFVHNNINVTTLLALGPLGWQGSDEMMRKRTEAQASRLGVYAMNLPELIETLVALFLRNSSSTGLSPSMIGDAVERASEVNNSPRRRRSPSDKGAVNPLFNGQFLLPGTFQPLWDYILMRFQDIQQRTYVDPRMFLSGTTKSLANLIDQMSNPLINEVWYDVRKVGDDGLDQMASTLDRAITGGYTSENMREFVSAAREANEEYGNMIERTAPYMVFRQRPLTAEEINALEGPTIDERMLVDMKLGKSDTDLHNLVSLEVPGVQMQLIRAQTGFTGFEGNRERSMESIRRNGLRFYQDQASAWPIMVDDVAIEAPLPSPTLLREWENRITIAGLDNPTVWTGSIMIPEYVRNLRIGGKLRIIHHNPPGVDPETNERVYYVDALDYSYDAAIGQFATRVALSRGYSTSQDRDAVA